MPWLFLLPHLPFSSVSFLIPFSLSHYILTRPAPPRSPYIHSCQIRRLHLVPSTLTMPPWLAHAVIVVLAIASTTVHYALCSLLLSYPSLHRHRPGAHTTAIGETTSHAALESKPSNFELASPVRSSLYRCLTHDPRLGQHACFIPCCGDPKGALELPCQSQ